MTVSLATTRCDSAGAAMSLDADRLAVAYLPDECEELLSGLTTDERASTIKLLQEKNLLTPISSLRTALHQCEEVCMPSTQLHHSRLVALAEADCSTIHAYELNMAQLPFPTRAGDGGAGAGSAAYAKCI